MKSIILSLALTVQCLFLVAQPPSGKAKSGTVYGAKTTADGAVDIAKVPAMLTSKDTVAVKVKAKVLNSCSKKGCWMNLVDVSSGKMIRIKVNDGEIEFPKNGAGKIAIAEGTLMKIELSKERAIAEAKHEADEMGRKFDPAAIKGPLTRYQIKGSGAVVLD